MSTRHPIQPLYVDRHGRTRFKRNAIVEALLDIGPLDMNRLAILPFEASDREQFAQLIGYSLDGFGELSYVTDETFDAAASTGTVPEEAPHPSQPLVTDDKGNVRFKPNAIVVTLANQASARYAFLRNAAVIAPRNEADLTTTGTGKADAFPQSEWSQFHQLCGMEVGEYMGSGATSQKEADELRREVERAKAEWKASRRPTA